jgi:hypothetical protein
VSAADRVRSSPSRLWQFGLCRIARVIARQTAQIKQHHAHEREFWRQQLRVARRLNWITFFAAVGALLTVFVLIGTLLDARRATVEANRAWIAVRTAFFDQLPAPTNPGDRFLVAITFDNPGKGAALNSSRFQEHFWITPPAVQPFFIEQLKVSPNNTCSKLANETEPVIGVVWPGAAVGGYTSRGSAPPILADAEFLNQHKLLGYHGCFRYETFGKPHFTAYCFFLDPHTGHAVSDWLWGSCPGKQQNFAD